MVAPEKLRQRFASLSVFLRQSSQSWARLSRPGMTGKWMLHDLTSGSIRRTSRPAYAGTSSFAQRLADGAQMPRDAITLAGEQSRRKLPLAAHEVMSAGAQRSAALPSVTTPSYPEKRTEAGTSLTGRTPANLPSATARLTSIRRSHAEQLFAGTHSSSRPATASILATSPSKLPFRATSPVMGNKIANDLHNQIVARTGRTESRVRAEQQDSIDGYTDKSSNDLSPRTSPTATSVARMNVGPLTNLRRKGQTSSSTIAPNDDSTPASLVLSGDIIVDGRQLAQIIASRHSRELNVAPSTGKTVNLRATPVFPGSSMPAP